jgi:hypothetical protein
MGGKFCCTPEFSAYFANMGWQQLLSLVIVAMAAVLLLASRFRRRKFNWQRDTHCGCAGNASIPPQNSIIFRARKGSPPEITIKMR